MEPAPQPPATEGRGPGSRPGPARSAASPPAELAGPLGLGTVCGVGAGLLSAVFLQVLDTVTAIRWSNPWLVFLMPLAGVLMLRAYQAWGRGAERGTSLILDAVRDSRVEVPWTLAPLVLGATLLSHLCGGSVGREGTAVQMGASLAAAIRRRFPGWSVDPSVALLTGMAGGFGAVFGTPWAGALYAIELPRTGGFSWRHGLPCLAASWSGHLTCLALGVRHAVYPPLTPFGPAGLSAWWPCAVAGIAFGLAARGFVACLGGWASGYSRWKGPRWMPPLLAASVVIGLSALLGTDAYQGLGVTGRLASDPSIVRSFEPGGVTAWSWLWKLLFTTATLAAGFKGGEVTPLFFIGAALGHSVADLAGWPVGQFAAMGFVAVFAAAGHTPWACVVLGWEIFGAAMIVPGLVAVTVADAVATGTGLHAHRTCSILTTRFARARNT